MVFPFVSINRIIKIKLERAVDIMIEKDLFDVLVNEYNRLEKEVEKGCNIICKVCPIAEKCGVYAEIYCVLHKQLSKVLEDSEFYYLYTQDNPFVVKLNNEVYSIYNSAGHTFVVENFNEEVVLNTSAAEEVIKYILF